MSVEFESSPLLISTLAVHLKSQSQKKIVCIIFKAGQDTRKICQTISPGGDHQESFDPPLGVSFDAKILVVVRFPGVWGKKTVTISLDPQDVLLGVNEEAGRQVYRKTEKEIEVVTGIQTLPSTVNKILAACSRFRVLTIGESGVGKSTLINKVFGVSGVDVSSTTRGKASIDQEFIATENAHFVVHDSCGFEAADGKNFVAVREFISNRRTKPDLRDQLHAVWLCLSIPYADGRLMEAGVEQFLKERQEILGNIPLVVVFTKLDLLVNSLEADAVQSGGHCSEAAVKERKQELLHRLCLTPIRRAAGSDDVPHVAISANEDYEDSLSALVEVTTKNIQKYIKDEAAYEVATIAQRVNISLKIALTIAVGEKCYWKALRASPNFGHQKMKTCLDVIHKDIVTVWNFKDPHSVLLKNDFKARLLDTSDLSVRDTTDVQRTVQTSVTTIAALVTIIAGVAGTGGAAIPIVVPIAGFALLTKLAHDLYRASQDNVKQLMAYIIDLTCVMQVIFLLSPACARTRNRDSSNSSGDTITVEHLECVMKAYDDGARRTVHADINAFNLGLTIAPGKRDHVLEEIKRLIRLHSVKDEELPALVEQLHSVHNGG